MRSSSKGYGGRIGPPATTIRKPLSDNGYDWHDQARCIKPEYEKVDFFPDLAQRDQVEKAKKVCRGCAVRDRCLDFAIANEIEFGIWGAMTAPERWAEEDRRDSLSR